MSAVAPFIRKMTANTMSPISFVNTLAIGFFTGPILQLCGYDNVETFVPFLILVRILLSGGLFGATFGIDTTRFNEDKIIIGAVVILGVPLKAAFVGFPLWYLFHEPVYLVIGIIMSQIDPIVMAVLAKTLPPRARTIAESWASFDDPASVMVCIFVAQFFVSLGLPINLGVGGWHEFVLGLCLQLLYAALIYAVWKFGLWGVRQVAQKCKLEEVRVEEVKILGIHIADKYLFYKKGGMALLYGILIMFYAVIVASVSLSAYLLWMLSIAIAGLYLRPESPKLEKSVDVFANVAFRILVFLLGLLMFLAGSRMSWDQIRFFVWVGIVTGLLTYTSQMVATLGVAAPVAWLIKRPLALVHIIKLMFCQQNGLTATNLAVFFARSIPGVVLIVPVAIVKVFFLHWAANRFLVNPYLVPWAERIQPATAYESLEEGKDDETETQTANS